MKKVLKGLWLAFLTPFYVLIYKRHSRKMTDGTREYYNQPFYKRVLDFFMLILVWPYVFYLGIKSEFEKVGE